MTVWSCCSPPAVAPPAVRSLGRPPLLCRPSQLPLPTSPTPPQQLQAELANLRAANQTLNVEAASYRHNRNNVSWLTDRLAMFLTHMESQAEQGHATDATVNELSGLSINLIKLVTQANAVAQTHRDAVSGE